MPSSVGREPVGIGVSVGCAIYLRDGRNVAALIEVADAYTYLNMRCRHGVNKTPPA